VFGVIPELLDCVRFHRCSHRKNRTCCSAH